VQELEADDAADDPGEQEQLRRRDVAFVLEPGTLYLLSKDGAAALPLSLLL
jgi:hypothetical protein